MTRRSPWIFALAVAGLLVWRGSLRADATNAAPDFKEVYELLRANLPGATDESLNRATVDGLLSQLRGKVSLVGGAADRSATNAILSKSVVLENNVAYLRAERITGNFADELGVANHALAATNKIAGVVLDLRFANGDDATSSRTAAKAIKAIANPLVVLVNGETRGAAEMLAAALRDAGAGLIIGNPTAGESSTFKELPLQNGQRLRIATTSGKPAVSVQPDVTVVVGVNDERTFLDNPYGALAQGDKPFLIGTNVFEPLIDHISEADLVRSKRNADKTADTEATQRANEPPTPVIRDPALARAVDLIKGLAAMRAPHS